jgi:hypothetical protein
MVSECFLLVLGLRFSHHCFRHFPGEIDLHDIHRGYRILYLVFFQSINLFHSFSNFFYSVRSFFLYPPTSDALPPMHASSSRSIFLGNFRRSYTNTAFNTNNSSSWHQAACGQDPCRICACGIRTDQLYYKPSCNVLYVYVNKSLPS